MKVTAIQLAEQDNVATLVADLAVAGPVTIVGGFAAEAVAVRAPIPRGHKIALRVIATGEPVVKFGAAIGYALQPIDRGEWVHLHNLASVWDRHSGKQDVANGPTAADTSAYG